MASSQVSENLTWGSAINMPVEPSYFLIEECERAASEGRAFLTCSQGHMVRLDRIAPDVALTDFEGNRIPFSDLALAEHPLAKGSYGEIFRATYKNSVVAVKRLMCDPLELQRIFGAFRREVWIMSSLCHPNLVNLLGYCLEPTPSMVMEFVNGGDLYSFIHKDDSNPNGPPMLDAALVLKIALDVANGVKFLHSAAPPFIHRDLKSPNILLLENIDPSADVVAKVADFGLTNRMVIPLRKEGRKDRAVSNPTWQAPEIMREEEFSEKSDTYAFGLILWELYTRKHPYGNIKTNFLHDIEDAVLGGMRPEIPEECPAVYANLITACWADNPDDRPSFTEITEALRDMIDQSGFAQVVRDSTYKHCHCYGAAAAAAQIAHGISPSSSPVLSKSSKSKKRSSAGRHLRDSASSSGSGTNVISSSANITTSTKKSPRRHRKNSSSNSAPSFVASSPTILIPLHHSSGETILNASPDSSPGTSGASPAVNAEVKKKSKRNSAPSAGSPGGTPSPLATPSSAVVVVKSPKASHQHHHHMPYKKSSHNASSTPSLVFLSSPATPLTSSEGSSALTTTTRSAMSEESGDTTLDERSVIDPSIESDSSTMYMEMHAPSLGDEYDDGREDDSSSISTTGTSNATNTTNKSTRSRKSYKRSTSKGSTSTSNTSTSTSNTNNNSSASPPATPGSKSPPSRPKSQAQPQQFLQLSPRRSPSFTRSMPTHSSTTATNATTMGPHNLPALSISSPAQQTSSSSKRPVPSLTFAVNTPKMSERRYHASISPTEDTSENSSSVLASYSPRAHEGQRNTHSNTGSSASSSSSSSSGSTATRDEKNSDSQTPSHDTSSDNSLPLSAHRVYMTSEASSRLTPVPKRAEAEIDVVAHPHGTPTTSDSDSSPSHQHHIGGNTGTGEGRKQLQKSDQLLASTLSTEEEMDSDPELASPQRNAVIGPEESDSSSEDDSATETEKAAKLKQKLKRKQQLQKDTQQQSSPKEKDQPIETPAAAVIAVEKVSEVSTPTAQQPVPAPEELPADTILSRRSSSGKRFSSSSTKRSNPSLPAIGEISSSTTPPSSEKRSHSAVLRNSPPVQHKQSTGELEPTMAGRSSPSPPATTKYMLGSASSPHISASSPVVPPLAKYVSSPLVGRPTKRISILPSTTITNLLPVGTSHIWGTGRDGSVHIWNAKNGDSIGTYSEAHRGMIKSAAAVLDTVWMSCPKTHSVGVWHVKVPDTGSRVEKRSGTLKVGVLKDSGKIGRWKQRFVVINFKDGSLKIFSSKEKDISLFDPVSLAVVAPVKELSLLNTKTNPVAFGLALEHNSKTFKVSTGGSTMYFEVEQEHDMLEWLDCISDIATGERLVCLTTLKTEWTRNIGVMHVPSVKGELLLTGSDDAELEVVSWNVQTKSVNICTKLSEHIMDPHVLSSSSFNTTAIPPVTSSSSASLEGVSHSPSTSTSVLHHGHQMSSSTSSLPANATFFSASRISGIATIQKTGHSIVAAGCFVFVLNTKSLEVVHVLRCHSSPIVTLAMVKSKEFWVSCEDGLIQAWDAASFTHIASFRLPQDNIVGSSNNNNSIEAEDDSMVYTITTHILAVTPSIVWTGGDDGMMRVWNSLNYTLEQELDGECSASIRSMALWHHSLWASSADNSLCIWT